MDYTIRLYGANDGFGFRDLHLVHASSIATGNGYLTYGVEDAGTKLTIVPFHRLHSITYQTPPRATWKNPNATDESYDGNLDSLEAAE